MNLKTEQKLFELLRRMKKLYRRSDARAIERGRRLMVRHFELVVKQESL